MSFCLALRRLLPLLAVLSLALSPATASAAAASMHVTMAMQGHAAAMPDESMDEMAGMAMDEMPCCPKEGPAMPDCSNGCPLMAVCLAKIATGLPVAFGLPIRLAVVENATWAVTASFDSLAQAPPAEPPRA